MLVAEAVAVALAAVAAQEEIVSIILIQEQVVHLLVHKDTLFQLVAEEQVDLVHRHSLTQQDQMALLHQV